MPGVSAGRQHHNPPEGPHTRRHWEAQAGSSPTCMGRHSLTKACKHMEGVKHTCMTHDTNRGVTAQQNRRRFWNSRGGHILSHTRQGKRSQPHTNVPPSTHKNAQFNHNAATRSMLHSSEPQLLELNVKCSRGPLLHGSLHDSSSAGGPKPWQCGSQQKRVDESPGASGTAPPCAAPDHKPGWWTG